MAYLERSHKQGQSQGQARQILGQARQVPKRKARPTGIRRSWSKSLCWRGSMGLLILPCEQWVVPAPNPQFENEFNLKTVLDWNRSRIGRFKCFMWRKWTVWSLCEVYVKSSHKGQKWSRWFYWSFYFVNAECKKRLTRINVSKQKSDER